jgi:hypothetical protein
MARTKRSALASLAVATAMAATGALTGLATAGTAHAASTAGGTITRSEVLSRAQSWVDEGVPYNQGAYWSDANGSYREDCSGYVSMAWHLTSSLVTQTLPNVSSVISFSQLKPGDALDYTAEHTFLFAGWTNQSNGDFTYYAESNPNDPTHGPTAANINNSSLEGWPTGNYEALRYNNIVDDPTAPMTNLAAGRLGSGHTDLLAIEASTGNLYLYPGTGTISSNTLGPRVQVGTSWNSMNELTLGDFNKSGHDSLIAVEKSTGNLYIYPGTGTINGDNTFGSRIQIGTGWGGMTNLTAINLGGTEGLLAIEKSTGNLYFYPGTGTISTNTLGARIQVGTGWNSMSNLTAPGILNKDGKADLIAVDSSTGNLYAYPFSGTVNGMNTFGSRVQVGTGWDSMSYLAGGDFNGDGNGDLIAVGAPSNAPGNLYAYPGTGALTFGARTQIGTSW